MTVPRAVTVPSAAMDARREPEASRISIVEASERAREETTAKGGSDFGSQSAANHSANRRVFERGTLKGFRYHGRGGEEQRTSSLLRAEKGDR